MTEQEKQKLEQVMRQTVADNMYMQFMGIELLVLEEGYAKGRMKFNRSICNPYEMIHGGALYSFADTVAGTAACMAGRYVTTVSGTMNFLAIAENTEYVYCEAKALRKGSHLTVFEARITNDDEKLIDSGEFTFYMLDKNIL